MLDLVDLDNTVEPTTAMPSGVGYPRIPSSWSPPVALKHTITTQELAVWAPPDFVMQGFEYDMGDNEELPEELPLPQPAESYPLVVHQARVVLCWRTRVQSSVVHPAGPPQERAGPPQPPGGTDEPQDDMAAAAAAPLLPSGFHAISRTAKDFARKRRVKATIKAAEKAEKAAKAAIDKATVRAARVAKKAVKAKAAKKVMTMKAMKAMKVSLFVIINSNSSSN